MMTLNPEVLRCDADVQPRLTLSDAHIQAYAALLQEDHDMGYIVVFQNGSDYWLADGFHRVAAANSIDLEELPAEIRLGSKRDAMLYACAANKHGQSLSNADKQRVVLHLLEDAEWGQWSDREIARHCGVGHALVSRLRRSLSPRDSDPAPRTYRTKQGTVTTMATRAIGKRTASPPATPAADAEAPVLPVAADDDETVLPEVEPQVTPDVQEQTEGMVPPSAPQDGAGRVPTPETIVDSAKTATPGPDTPGLSSSDPAPGSDFDPRVVIRLLQTLKALPDAATVVTEIPPIFAPRINLYLAGALAWLSTFTKEWKSHTATSALLDEEHDEE